MWKKRKTVKRSVVKAEPVPLANEALLELAVFEPNDRRQRFLVTLVHGLLLLSPDDMDAIEPCLHRAIGRFRAQAATAEMRARKNRQ